METSEIFSIESSDADPGCFSRIPDTDFFPQDLGSDEKREQGKK
jgi:hypothetical protein